MLGSSRAFRGSALTRAPEHSRLSLAIAAIVVALVLIVVAHTNTIRPHLTSARDQIHTAIAYDDLVQASAPVAYWPLDRPKGGFSADRISGIRGTFVGDPMGTVMPNGDTATSFDGVDQYFEATSSDLLSPVPTGELTVEAWMRPDTLQFAEAEREGYVHWLGKGEAGEHEFAARIYNLSNSVDRPSRVSGYSFEAAGGLGAGSFFEDELVPGQWVHYVFVINTKERTDEFPDGYTKIYRDGILRAKNNLSIHGNSIQPDRTRAPFRVATRDFESFFNGAVGKVSLYDRELAPVTICAHTAQMIGGRAECAKDPSRVAAGTTPEF